MKEINEKAWKEEEKQNYGFVDAKLFSGFEDSGANLSQIGIYNRQDLSGSCKH